MAEPESARVAHRVLVAIPHFFRAGVDDAHGSTAGLARPRILALAQCLRALRTLFDSPQESWLRGDDRLIARPCNQARRLALDIVVCTTGDAHLLDRLPLPAGCFRHHPTDCDPRLLGFECHAVLRDGLGRYDTFAYLEDDLVLHDPSFFEKLAWLGTALGADEVLQPLRYEAVLDAAELKKVYIDVEMPVPAGSALAETREVGWFGGRVRLRRAGNPHAGCFFLDERRMRRWVSQRHFLDRDTSFVGPLESAATLGLLRTFKVFKPALENANILEVQHAGQVWSRKLPTVRIP